MEKWVTLIPGRLLPKTRLSCTIVVASLAKIIPLVKMPPGLSRTVFSSIHVLSALLTKMAYELLAKRSLPRMRAFCSRAHQFDAFLHVMMERVLLDADVVP